MSLVTPIKKMGETLLLIKGVTSRSQTVNSGSQLAKRWRQFPVIRVYDAAGNVRTHEHKGEFKEW